MQLVHARRQLAVQRAHWENEVQKLTHARDERVKRLAARVLAFVVNKMHQPWQRELATLFAREVEKSGPLSPEPSQTR